MAVLIKRMRLGWHNVYRAVLLASVFEVFCGIHTVSAQERVISTDASITAIVEALGQEQRLVAIDVTSRAPVSNPALPRIGYHRSLSAEGLLSLNPDALLASEHAGPPNTLATLRDAGVAVTVMPAPLTVPVLQHSVRTVGAALGEEARANDLATELADRAAALQADKLDAIPAVLLREGEGGIRVAGRDTAGAALLKLLGARNLAAHPGYRSYSEEALIALEPALILIALRAEESMAAWLDRHPLLRFTPAASNEQVFAVDAGALVGGVSIATLSEAESLIQQLRDNEVHAAAARR